MSLKNVSPSRTHPTGLDETSCSDRILHWHEGNGRSSDLHLRLLFRHKDAAEQSIRLKASGLPEKMSVTIRLAPSPNGRKDAYSSGTVRASHPIPF